MSDIFCAVCAEPWESYGQGDMMRWQWELFRAGAGCPCCEGVPSDDENTELATESHLRSVVFGGGADDPDSFGMLHGDARPAWVEPPEPVLVSCAGCGLRVVRSHETNEPECSRGRDYRVADFATVGDESYCPDCYSACWHCDAPVLRGCPDVYGDGCGVYLQNADRTVCGGCLDSVCTDCGDQHTDCDCDEQAWRYSDLRVRIASCVQQRISIFAARHDDAPAGWSREY